MSGSSGGLRKEVVFRYASIMLLISSNVAYGLLLPLCRTPDSNGNVFFGPSSVVVVEIFKILLSTFGLIIKHLNQFRNRIDSNEYTAISINSIDEKQTNKTYDNIKTYDEENISDMISGKSYTEEESDTYHSLRRNRRYRNLSILSLAWDDVWNAGALHLLSPSVLYVIQNNLQILAAGYLAPAEFQAVSQLKLVTTALFAIWLLKKQLLVQHWASIIILCLGIVLVRGADSILGFVASDDKGMVSKPGIWTVGVPSLLIACICAGLASVLTEMRLKGKETCFWAINIQLSVFSLIPSLLPVIVDCIARRRFDPLRYFNTLTWVLIIINITGSFLVSIVIKYSDSILKGFAVSIALLLTIFTSSLTTGLPLTWFQIYGGILIAGSSFYYGQVPKKE